MVINFTSDQEIILCNIVTSSLLFSLNLITAAYTKASASPGFKIKSHPKHAYKEWGFFIYFF